MTDHFTGDGPTNILARLDAEIERADRIRVGSDSPYNLLREMDRHRRNLRTIRADAEPWLLNAEGAGNG